MVKKDRRVVGKTFHLPNATAAAGDVEQKGAALPTHQ